MQLRLVAMAVTSTLTAMMERQEGGVEQVHACDDDDDDDADADADAEADDGDDDDVRAASAAAGDRRNTRNRSSKLLLG